MDSLTEPVTKQPRRAADTHTAIQWLDALSSGECDRAAFLRGVGDVLQNAPDAGWEVLALLDQYYRRGKISADAFGEVKAHIQSALLGKGKPAISGPMPVAPGVQGEPGPAPPASPRAVAVGNVLRARYLVQGILGQGGMGTVFSAIDQFRLDRSNDDQRIALKVLHSAVIRRPRLFAELRREFQHLQSLSHPNIVRVHEFDRDGDIAFFTMEYLSGGHLAQVLLSHQGLPLYRPYAFAILRDVGAAVVHAHSRGVIHGDLNPVNIFITDNGEVRVLDFGASHQMRRSPWISEFEASDQTPVATPGYASCQLLEGETADVRDDAYAFANIAYVLLTGHHPFGRHSALQARTLKLVPRRPRGLTNRQWKTLRQGLYFDRERRPADLQAWLLRLDLRAASPALPALPKLLATARRPRQRLRIALVAGAVVLGLLACATWWAVTHTRPLEPAVPDSTADPVRVISGPAESPVQPARHTDPVSESPTVRPVPNPPAPASAPITNESVVTASQPSARPAVPAGATARPRIELTVDNVDLGPGESTAHITLRRSRLMRGDASFSWWTESGTAKPGRDYEPVKSHVEQVGEGNSMDTLSVSILPDPSRHGPRSFYVLIDAAGDDAAVGPRTLTQVTIGGSDAASPE